MAESFSETIGKLWNCQPQTLWQRARGGIDQPIAQIHKHCEVNLQFMSISQMSTKQRLNCYSLDEYADALGPMHCWQLFVEI